MFNHVTGLLFKPDAEWQRIATAADSVANFLYVVVLALIPAIAWYYGTTHIGWSVGEGEMLKLTTNSGQIIIALFYLAMLATIAVIGYFIHWMAINYGAESSWPKGIAVAGYTATPLFLAGATGFHPLLWLDMLVGVCAVAWSLYLLYVGIPIVMKVPKERGFLFASAIVAVCMVMLILLMTGSVILWDMGAEPEFTN